MCVFTKKIPDINRKINYIPIFCSSPGSTETKKPEANTPNDISHNKVTISGTNRTQVIVRNSSSGELQVSVPEGAVPSEAAATTSASTASKTEKSSTTAADAEEEAANKKRPLITKSIVCRLLAELVKSYGSCATLITEHVFESGMSELVKEDTTALAFLLDELLVSKTADKEISNLIKTLVAALASCNHSPGMCLQLNISSVQ